VARYDVKPMISTQSKCAAILHQSNLDFGAMVIFLYLTHPQEKMPNCMSATRAILVVYLHTV